MYGEGVFDYLRLEFERLSEHCIFRVNLGSAISIFTVLGLIFVSRLSMPYSIILFLEKIVEFF